MQHALTAAIDNSTSCFAAPPAPYFCHRLHLPSAIATPHLLLLLLLLWLLYHTTLQSPSWIV
jgi:hypothetical protein